MDVVEEIENVINSLDKLEEYMSNLSKSLSIVDQKISDLEHHIENKKINAFQAFRVINELQKVLKERRTIKNNIELAKVYRANDTKLIKKCNRKLLIQDLNSRLKDLNCEYNNRVYTKEELEEIIGGKNE